MASNGIEKPTYEPPKFDIAILNPLNAVSSSQDATDPNEGEWDIQ